MTFVIEQLRDIDGESYIADRRNFIKGSLAGLAAAGFIATSPLAKAQFRAPTGDLRLEKGAFDETHELKPLPFDAAKLNGLSARLIESHWSNNYGGSIGGSNAILAETPEY